MSAAPSAEGPSAGEAIATRALAAWGLTDGVRLRLLKHRENLVFAVEIAGRPQYALRVHRRGYHSDLELSSELRWMATLAEAGIPTPRVMQTLRGELFTSVTALDGQSAYQCDLLSWVPGEQLGRIEDAQAGEAHYIECSYEQVGRLAARMHAHSEWWRPQPPFHRHSWDEEGVLGPGALWGYYGDLQSLDPAQRALLDRAAAAARQRLGQFGKSMQRYGLVHADLVPENVLLDGEHCTIIDFDDSGFGWYVGDIATAVFFHLGTANFEPALQAMLRGYRQERVLKESELEVLDVLLFMRGMAVFGWVHTRSETQTAHDLRAPVTSIVFALARALEGSYGEFHKLRAPSLARGT